MLMVVNFWLGSCGGGKSEKLVNARLFTLVAVCHIRKGRSLDAKLDLHRSCSPIDEGSTIICPRVRSP
jgi:hypothetical protein